MRGALTCLGLLLVATQLSAQEASSRRALDEATGRAERKDSEKRQASTKQQKPACDPADPECQPCKEDKEQASCCDPEKSPLCKDMSLKVVGVPVPVYNPQLQFSLGLLGMVTYHPFKDDKVSPPWATVVFGMYTTNKSWLLGV